MGEHERVRQVRSGELFVGIGQAGLGAGSVPAPLFFPDVASVMVVLLAPTPAVRALLPSPRLRPVQVLPGRTFVWFSASDLRGGDLGPHQQLMVSVPVRVDGGGQGVLPALRGSGAWWTVDMPVSSPRARDVDVDVDVFGFPSEVAELDVRVNSTSAEVRWLHEGRMVLELDAQVRRARPYAGSRMRLESVSAKDGRLLGAWWMLRIEQMSVSRLRPSARLRLGDSPRADRLRGLGLEGRCLGLHVIPHAEAVLTPPVESWDAYVLPVRPRGERLVEVAR
ncbi:MAG: hypothetical protein ACTHOD_09460 [Motilibacteraceae bacterium]